MTLKKICLTLLLAICCFIVVPKAVKFVQQQHLTEMPDLITNTENNDAITFLQMSAKQIGLEITVEPALSGQWQLAIAENSEKKITYWLDHLKQEGFGVQSIRMLNTEKEGIVRVPSLTLMNFP